MHHFENKIIVAGLIVVGMTGAAAADVLGVAARTTPATGTNTVFAPVPINDAGAVSLAFTTTEPNDRVVFTYNAECSGINGGGWLSVQIIVDNRFANPNSGANFAFCHAGVEAGAVRQSFFTVGAAGTHTVRVRAAVQGGSTTWTLDDSSLVVEN